jgi:hypothetical protein
MTYLAVIQTAHIYRHEQKLAHGNKNTFLAGAKPRFNQLTGAFCPACARLGSPRTTHGTYQIS